MTVDWAQVGVGAVAGATFLWKVLDDVRDRRLRKKYNLKENPTRCQEHGEAIARLDERLKDVEEDVREIRNRLG